MIHHSHLLRTFPHLCHISGVVLNSRDPTVLLTSAQVPRYGDTNRRNRREEPDGRTGKREGGHGGGQAADRSCIGYR